jgi:hypothetical protein
MRTKWWHAQEPDSDDCDIGEAAYGLWGLSKVSRLEGVVPIPDEPITEVSCAAKNPRHPLLSPGAAFCCGINSEGMPTCWGAVNSVVCGSTYYGYGKTLMNNLPEEFADIPDWLVPTDCSIEDGD